jgi:hypothetical protein
MHSKKNKNIPIFVVQNLKHFLRDKIYFKRYK